MQENKIRKISIILLSFLATSVAFAQDNGTFAEKNLSDSTPKQPQKKEADSALSIIKDNAAIPGQIKDSLESILLNQKAVSLMFDDEQNTNINRAVESLKNDQIFIPEGESVENVDDKAKEEKKEDNVNEKSYIYLASIIYFSPKNWAVWINDQKITSETNDKSKELYLPLVQRDRVKLKWTLSVSKWKILSGRQSEELAPKINSIGQIEVDFELKPNQTFILSTNNTVEGRAVIAILKKRLEEKKEKEKKSESEGEAETKPRVNAGQSGM